MLLQRSCSVSCVFGKHSAIQRQQLSYNEPGETPPSDLY